ESKVIGFVAGKIAEADHRVLFHERPEAAHFRVGAWIGEVSRQVHKGFAFGNGKRLLIDAQYLAAHIGGQVTYIAKIGFHAGSAWKESVHRRTLLSLYDASGQAVVRP